jgi:1,4-dihydroxy-2-naphthoate octaprenyltransferase
MPTWKRGGPSSTSSPAGPSDPVNVWIEAARPRTLPAAVAPVLVGTAAAHRFLPLRFAGAMVVALAIQVGVNYANDYFDGTKGIDSEHRTGPRRAVASGLVAPTAMRRATAAAFGVAALAGVALALVAGIELLIVGALCFLAAIGYSGGPRPYGSAGLGELFVFVFFGLVATTGSAYVQIEEVTRTAVTAAVPIGLLAAAILVANNLRDLPTDAAAGKITVAVRLGPARTATLYRALVFGAFPFLVLLAGLTESAWPLLAFAALPLTLPLYRGVMREEPAALIRVLAGTARLELVFGILMAVGLWTA